MILRHEQHKLAQTSIGKQRQAGQGARLVPNRENVKRDGMEFSYSEYEKPKEVGYLGCVKLGEYNLFRTFEDELVVFKGTKNTGIVLRK